MRLVIIAAIIGILGAMILTEADRKTVTVKLSTGEVVTASVTPIFSPVTTGKEISVYKDIFTGEYHVCLGGELTKTYFGVVTDIQKVW